MKRIYLLLAGIMIVVLMLVGCINYDQTTILNADNSGTIEIHYTSDSYGSDNAPVLPITENGILNSYPSGFVRDIVIVDEEGGISEVTYFLDFENIGDLNGCGVFAVDDYVLQTFEIVNDDKMRIFTQTLEIAADDGETDISDYNVTYTVKTPRPIISSNGEIDDDGRAVSWEYSPSDIVDKTTVMEVVYDRPISPFGDFSDFSDYEMQLTWLLLITFGIVIAIVVFVVLIVIILYIMKKKRDKQDKAAFLS